VWCLQHPWSETIRAAVDLESMGVGGKHYLFQVSPLPYTIVQLCRRASVSRELAVRCVTI